MNWEMKREPDECSFCGSDGHTRRYCAAYKESRAEAEEMRADAKREERLFERQGDV